MMFKQIFFLKTAFLALCSLAIMLPGTVYAGRDDDDKDDRNLAERLGRITGSIIADDHDEKRSRRYAKEIYKNDKTAIYRTFDKKGRRIYIIKRRHDDD